MMSGYLFDLVLLITLGVGLALGLTLARQMDWKESRRRPRRGEAPVRVERVGLTAGNTLLLVHYRVVGGGRLPKDTSRLRIIDEDTGSSVGTVSLPRPAVKTLRAANGRSDGYIVVPNRGDLLKPGSLISLKMGIQRWRHVPVD